jgi:ribosome-associated protein
MKIVPHFCSMKLKDRNFEPEFKFKTSKSSGAGGQHVNTTETKVELIFDINQSPLLGAAEKDKLHKKLAGQINDKGELRINSSESRSQSANKEKVIAKFYAVLEKALKKEKRRIPTKVPMAVKENILQKKKEHSKKKQERRFNAKDLL